MKSRIKNITIKCRPLPGDSIPCRVLVSVVCSFIFLDQTFCIHRPIKNIRDDLSNRYHFITLKKGWSCSHYLTGKRIPLSGNPLTIKAAKCRAMERLTDFIDNHGKETLISLLSQKD